jgi:hypothetical protein
VVGRTWGWGATGGVGEQHSTDVELFEDGAEPDLTRDARVKGRRSRRLGATILRELAMAQ